MYGMMRCGVDVPILEISTQRIHKFGDEKGIKELLLQVKSLSCDDT
jgi:hypothetical protein